MWDKDFENHLLNSRSCSDFLSHFFSEFPKRNSPKKISYQRFSVLSGISSRGFISDILSKKKRMSYETLDKIKAGLKLKKNWSDFLDLTYKIEYLDLSKGERISLESKLDKIKNKIKSALGKNNLKAERNNISLINTLLKPNHPQIIASLGEENIGATLEEIKFRTNLSVKIVEAALAEMISENLVKFVTNSNRYTACHQLTEIYHSQNSQIFFKDYLNSLSLLESRFRNSRNRTEFLFVTQTFSVDSKVMLQLKEQLSQLIVDFTDDSEISNGDCIGEICLGFTHNK